jgi:hypothetical protein
MQENPRIWIGYNHTSIISNEVIFDSQISENTYSDASLNKNKPHSTNVVPTYSDVSP